jgi:hypothetical protein
MFRDFKSEKNNAASFFDVLLVTSAVLKVFRKEPQVIPVRAVVICARMTIFRRR